MRDQGPVRHNTAGDRTGHHRPAHSLDHLQATSRLHARSTYDVLVDAVASCFYGQQPDLS
jgi:hypothetical protein